MIEIIEPFHVRLKKALSIRGMSQTDLSKATNIREGTISHYATGYAKPKKDRLVLIANILKVNPTWLMGLDVPMDLASDVQNFKEHVMEPFNAKFAEKNKPESTFEELRTAYARNRNKLTKEERMALAAEILMDDEPKI